ncbi:MAG: Na+/H+ antiporter subunit E [Gammaproteobacteria bacterium]|nr:Na+/H+ antiporter subunit E [Gammaproteobacteria bacterium]
MGITAAKNALIRMRWGELAGRFLAVLALWWVLVEGDASTLAEGSIVAALVAGLGSRAFPRGRHRVRWRAFPAFVLYFIGRSIIAGLDVARRLLTPSLPILPGVISVPLEVPDGAPRWLLANTLSLLPGTLSVDLHDDRLELHCLDTGVDISGSVRRTEDRVAALFGVATVCER